MNFDNMFGMSGMFDGMFRKVGSDMCRLTMNGKIAVRTAPGVYKSYDVKRNRLVNHSNFAFDIGNDWFFVVLLMGGCKAVRFLLDSKIRLLSSNFIWGFSIGYNPLTRLLRRFGGIKQSDCE